MSTFADLIRPFGADGLRRLEVILDQLADGVAVFDQDWEVVWLNRTGAELLGRSAAELLGRDFWSAFPGSDATAAHREYLRAAAERREVDFEIFHEPLGVWFEVRAIPTSDGLIALYRDVTDRRRDAVLLEGNLRAMTQLILDSPLTSVLDVVTSTVERESPHGALASVLLASDDGLRLHHGSAPGLPDFYNQTVDGLLIGPCAGSCGTAAFRREQVVVEDIEQDELWEQWRPVARAAGLRACWSTPVLDPAGRLLGTFAMYYRAPRRPEPADQRLIAQATGTVALAIEHDRRSRALHQALAAATSAAARSRRLQQLAAELTSALMPEQVARIGAEYAREALGAEGAWVAVHDSGSRSRLLASTGGPEGLGTAVPGLGLPRQAGRQGPEPLWLASPTEIRSALGDDPAGGRGSLAILPLQAEGRTLGELGVQRAGFVEFDPDGRGEALAVADQAAQALLRASQFATTRRVAESLQRSLLTDPPELDGLKVAVRYRPATTAADVGGDWYDAFMLPSGLHLVIGDVMGHDLDAAGRMGQLRSFLRTLAHDRGGDPASLLQRLDDLNEELQVTEFTSLILARVTVDGSGLGIEWSNAGHPSPVLTRPDGTSSLLTGPVDPPLGVGTGMARRNSTAHLTGDVTLLFYTDGLVELTTHSIDDRIHELRRHAAGHAAAALDGFCDAVLAFADHTADDVAVVAVRATDDR